MVLVFMIVLVVLFLIMIIYGIGFVRGEYHELWCIVKCKSIP